MIDNSLVIIINTEKKQNDFFKFIKKINKLSKKKLEIYMGIDFEFNTKKVALMQILFEIRKKEKIIKKYYIIYPPDLNINIFLYLKTNIMANSSILKILHGSESLDIPYLIDDFFNMSTDLELVINFFLSMIDTRYLCEYLNIENSKPNICRIYDLLEKIKIISPNEKLLLEANENKMGNISEIFIDIKTITTELITYSIHDVVYLIELYSNLKNQIMKLNSKNYFLLIDLHRYCFMEKRNITNIGDDIIIINQMNNYFYNIPPPTGGNKNNTYYKIKMIETYEIILTDFCNINNNTKLILNVNYLKTNLLNLFKTIIYSIILKYYTVNSSNTKFVNYNLESKIKLINEGLISLDLLHLFKFINTFYDFVNNKISPSLARTPPT